MYRMSAHEEIIAAIAASNAAEIKFARSRITALLDPSSAWFFDPANPGWPWWLTTRLPEVSRSEEGSSDRICPAARTSIRWMAKPAHEHESVRMPRPARKRH